MSEAISVYTMKRIAISAQMSQDSTSAPTPNKGSLFTQLKGFDKSNLHKTDTVVRTADGRSLVESKNDEGRTVVTQTSSGDYGFVPSVVEDLQVGEIVPGLIMGLCTFLSFLSSRIAQSELLGTVGILLKSSVRRGAS